MIAPDAPEKVLEQLRGAAHPGRQPQVGRGKTEVRQSQTWRDGIRNGQLAGPWRAVMAGEVGRRQARPPGPCVGRKDGIRRAGLRQHLVAFEDHLVLAIDEVPSVRRQPRRDGSIALPGDGFVIAVGINGRHVEFARQTRNQFGRTAVAHDQPAAPFFAQRGIEFPHRAQDEIDAPVGREALCQQGRQDIGVEDEGAIHPVVLTQGPRERGMVNIAQVAAEPDEGGICHILTLKITGGAPGFPAPCGEIDA